MTVFGIFFQIKKEIIGLAVKWGRNKGVYKYDTATQQITNYKVMDGLQEVNLLSMYKDNAEKLWLGTPSNGVFTFNGTSFERFIP